MASKSPMPFLNPILSVQRDSIGKKISQGVMNSILNFIMTISYRMHRNYQGTNFCGFYIW